MSCSRASRRKCGVEGGLTGGGLTVSFPAVRTASDAARLADDVFALPARLADRLNRRLVIALDEFQAIAAYNGGSVEQALRAAVQQQRQVGYVFAGSEPSLMEQMIGPKRPFYKAGPVMRLGRIPADTFARWVDERFRRSGLAPEAGLGAAIVDLAGNLPYDVQRLAHETWDDVVRGAPPPVDARRSPPDAAAAARRTGPAASRRSGSASRSRSAPCSAPSCSSTASSCSARTCARATGSAARRASRPRSPRSSVSTSSPAKTTDTTSSSTR